MIRTAPQRGYVLLPVIVVITLVAAIALLMNTESAIESNTAATELDAQQAQYVAAAGLNHAMWLSQQQGCGPYGSLTDEPLGNDKYTTSLTTDLGSTNAMTINVDQDSWIRSDLPTENKASDLKLHTRNETLGTERPLLRYDLSPIAPNAPILSATAWFYVTNAHAAGPIDIHLTSADWTETDATWDSMNANMDGAVLATIPSQAVIGIWIPVNLTAQVQAWVNGQPNFGITLNSTVDGVHGQYNSRESANPPYLDVVVGTPPTSPAKLKAVGTLANGVKRTIKDKAVTLVQHPASFVQWQHDAAAGVDAYIWEFRPTTNYGTDSETWVSQSNNNTSLSLFKFDVDKLLPGTRILNATLSLMHQSGNNTNVPVSAHRIANAWNEATVTWRQRDAGVEWDTWGGDLDQRAVSTTLVGPASGIRYEWDLTSLVQGWAGHIYPNYGVALQTSQNGSIGERFYTSDETDATRRPRLTITYTCACGQVCVAPQGSGKILMVVISPTVLVAEDQQAKDLFESWGYTVSVISESASQSSYDTAVSANDVVFISETVNSNQVGSKLANAPIGVVSQDGVYNPDLGLASGSALKVGAEINVTDTDHYITRVFPIGQLPIYAAGMEQLVTTGAITADQQTLAQIGGDASLVVLDQGDAMEGGGNAAGRRVILPLGTRYRFNWGHLNANGRLLVQRALAWGVGAAAKSSGTVLLVVVDPGSLTAQEDAKKTLIEGWGYSVTLIDESDSQANFDAAAALADVAYVAEDITSGELGTKLREATIGVVIEEEKITDEFGISSGETTFTEASIEITDNTHYITQPFSLGVVAFASSAQPVGGRAGTLAPGLQILALQPSSSTSMLDVIDTGGALFDTGTAAGRRVKLPWGGNDFDINQLTDDGRTIIRRAIEWGVSVAPPPSQQLLFVVPSPGSLGPTDSAKQALFESWGYTVNQIDDDAPLADFQAAIAANTVAYVAPTAVPGSVGSKLFKAGIGVVNANSGLHDDFGFSTMRYISSTNAALNTVASHYITQPFNGVQVTLYSSDQISGGAVGTLAADLDQIGLWSSGGLSPLGGLVTLEAGAMTSIGEITPGRRVQMPWDNLDVSTLTGDGLIILQRALEWAGGANIDLGPLAHWKLDETSGPTAVDSEGGHDGTWANGPAATPGVLDGGLDFDGSNDYVDVGSFDVSGSGITMMGWFNAEVIATDDGRIVSKANGPNEAEAWWQLSTTDVGASRFLRMRIKAGGTTTTFADNSVNLVTDQWYFAVATYDSASGSMKLYLDGVEIRSGTHALGGALDTDPSVPVALGANGTAERFFNGILDDVRVYDYALDAGAVADYYAANPPPGAASYTELYQPWSASSASAWETVDLAPLGVPANAVVEVAVLNADAGKEQWGGVRAVGSALERRLLLHEPESGGVDAITMHVQADASARIQHYSSQTGDVTFALLGYWSGASYAEAFEPFTANAVNTWVDEAVGALGVGANQVAEVLMVNNNGGAELSAGVRASGTTHERRFLLHEAESGGVDTLTLMVAADASSTIEVYAGDGTDIDFYVLGTWSNPPGIYVGTGGSFGQVSAPATWETVDLSGFGVAADSVAQFVIANENMATENSLRVRAVGSTINNRGLNLQEAEGGGLDLGSLHVAVDASAQVQWAAGQGATGGFFYPVGWWLLSP